jgi:hypothetical protein
VGAVHRILDLVHHHSASDDRGFEEIVNACELFDSSTAFQFGREAGPHVGHYDDVLKGGVSAQLAEDAKVGSGESADAEVRDSVNVDDSVEGLAFTVSGGWEFVFVKE